MNDEKSVLVKVEDIKKGDAVGLAVVTDTRLLFGGDVVQIDWMVEGVRTKTEYFRGVELAVTRKVEPLDLGALGFDFDLCAKEHQSAGDGIQTYEFYNAETGECVTVETNVPNFTPRILSRIYGNQYWKKRDTPATRGPQITFIIH